MPMAMAMARSFSPRALLLLRQFCSGTILGSHPEPAPTPALSALRQRLANGGPDLNDFLRASVPEDTQYSVDVGTKKNPIPKPPWMKRILPGGEKYTAIKAKLRDLNLHTVCEEAKCPNIGECWSGGETGTATATIMIMGDTCTRGCRFCAVKTSRTPPPLDVEEPTKVAEAIAAWGLDYIVITSVDRDDLPDQGSSHFAETVRRIKEKKPNMLVEALVPDFRGVQECVERVATSGLDVFAHNIETVEELQSSVRDHRANFAQSLGVLKMAKSMAPESGILTKTSIMLGCGETPAQVIRTMELVKDAGVDVMTFGQYMRPTKRHMPVSEYVTPQAFEQYRKLGIEMGFRYVASGPMAKELYGVFEAASRGGLNLVPEAFQDSRGAYTAQVRFTVIRDYLPSADEETRDVLRDNLSQKSKFDCELSGSQVVEIIQLFSQREIRHQHADGPAWDICRI